MGLHCSNVSHWLGTPKLILGLSGIGDVILGEPILLLNISFLDVIANLSFDVVDSVGEIIFVDTRTLAMPPHSTNRSELGYAVMLYPLVQTWKEGTRKRKNTSYCVANTGVKCWLICMTKLATYFICIFLIYMGQKQNLILHGSFDLDLLCIIWT